MLLDSNKPAIAGPNIVIKNHTESIFCIDFHSDAEYEDEIARRMWGDVLGPGSSTHNDAV